MAENILADAQFGIVRILRPYTGFDALDGSPGSYQGRPSTLPIMVTEGGLPLDEAAGQTGYSPVLLRGLSVPYGSRVTIWVPLVAPVVEGGAPTGYIWAVCWRLRNTFDFRQRRIPYHYPKAAAGVPYITSPRVVIPAASQSVVYNQAEPTAFPLPAVQTGYAEAIQFQFSINLVPPLLPNGQFGAMEQGVVDLSGTGSEAITTTYQVAELQALGDEMLLGLYRSPDAGANWDFTTTTGIDYQLSVLLGNGSGKAYPDAGVYVMTGSAP